MQLITGGSCRDDVLESEPILRQPDALGRSEVMSSSDSPEIISAGGDFTVVIPDLQSHESDADETCNLVTAEEPQCCICLDSEGEDLISPCYCRGTQKYVHRSCLDNWRSTKEGFAFSHCTECRAVFLLANVPSVRWWLRLKFQFLVAGYHALIFVIVQLIVASLGLLVYKFYGEELREMFGCDEHPYGFYTMAGVPYQSHFGASVFHINQQDEYIVEDGKNELKLWKFEINNSSA
ncbi:hypothetical protein MLD38_004970 [Melastoma candidum]|uniref:Uncharacterized protein n=1 Tax=Melastoma candidum TaxID=119954 RepID=A0ACB9SFZ6_9MYRT|nr:hypothetical protein MLD38_004970 [Melastoma candidum]